jgi:uncharacterized membrane protein
MVPYKSCTVLASSDDTVLLMAMVRNYFLMSCEKRRVHVFYLVGLTMRHVELAVFPFRVKRLTPSSVYFLAN